MQPRIICPAGQWSHINLTATTSPNGGSPARLTHPQVNTLAQRMERSSRFSTIVDMAVENRSGTGAWEGV